MRLLTVIALVICVFGAQLVQSEGAKILATFPFPGRSQYIFLEGYLKALAAKGHQVTVINAFKNKPTPNMRFIEALKCHEHHEDYITLESKPTLWQNLNVVDYDFTIFIKGILEDKGVQDLMKSGETFDLMLVEMAQMEPLYGLAQHFNATLAGFSSCGIDVKIDEDFGNISPVSYNPLITSSRSDRMTFTERLSNHYEKIVETIHRHLVHLPAMEKLYRKYFPNAQQSLRRVMDSFSIVLLGQHFSLSYPRPLLPNMIEIGGLHIPRERKPLPEDIQQFIETATEGVIYFSMGSNLNNSDLPLETHRILFNTFAKLNQRILWKFEDDDMPDKPKNVMIRKWFPQSEILAHPNVKLFISHGGLLSTIESVYFGKPVLAFPCVFDQYLNTQRVQRLGLGLGLDIRNLKQNDLELAIEKLINTPKFRETAAAISERYRDQPEGPLERAIWWTEYVIRHKGATHLRSASRDLSFLQLHSLDTLAVLLGVPLLGGWLLLRLVFKVFPSKPKSRKFKKV